jgi:hypothetical protein
MVEFQAGNPFTTGKHCGLCQLMELTSVDEGFQDILLDAKIVVANGGELFSQLWEVLHGLFDPIVSHVIGSRFGAQAQVITDVPLEKAVCVVRANAMPTKIIRSLHESIDDLIYRRSRLGSDPLHFH